MPPNLPDDELAPAPQFDLLGLMACHAVVPALQLGVFDALATGPADPAELAERIDVDPYGLRILLAALTEVGYLESTADTYANTPATAHWLTGDGHWRTVLPLWVAMLDGQWSDLDNSVRTGKPPATFYSWLDQHPAERELFHDLQRGLGIGLAAELTELAKIPPTAQKVIDVGGGEAIFSIALCARHPTLTATVLDLPSIVPAGKDRIAAAGLAHRITMRGTDLAHELDEHDQDVVLLCNVVHGFAPDRARALVAECVRALRPGGTLLLLETAEQPHDGSVPRSHRAFNRFFDLHLWHTQAGRIYPVTTLAGWLAEAGCAVHRTDLSGHPTHTLLTAQKP
jgi:SAM-dependent methyltransferase